MSETKYTAQEIAELDELTRLVNTLPEPHRSDAIAVATTFFQAVKTKCDGGTVDEEAFRTKHKDAHPLLVDGFLDALKAFPVKA